MKENKSYLPYVIWVVLVIVLHIIIQFAVAMTFTFITD